MIVNIVWAKRSKNFFRISKQNLNEIVRCIALEQARSTIREMQNEELSCAREISDVFEEVIITRVKANELDGVVNCIMFFEGKRNGFFEKLPCAGGAGQAVALLGFTHLHEWF